MASGDIQLLTDIDYSYLPGAFGFPFSVASLLSSCGTCLSARGFAQGGTREIRFNRVTRPPEIQNKGTSERGVTLTGQVLGKG